MNSCRHMGDITISPIVSSEEGHWTCSKVEAARMQAIEEAMFDKAPKFQPEPCI